MAATSTRASNSEIEALEAEIADLMREVDRYRTACEDSMQQLDWCIGYFTGCNKRALARALATNRSAIRRNVLKRDEQSMPTNNEESR